MRGWRRPHAAWVLVVLATGLAGADPPGTPQAPPPEPWSDGAPPPKAVPPVTPAGSVSADQINDLPAWVPGPAKVAVTPFENHVGNGRALDWIIAEAPFEMAEKLGSVLGLDPVGDPLYVAGEWVPAEPDTVAAYGRKLGANYVITGWYDKIGDALRIDTIVWRIQNGAAHVAGEAQQQGPMTSYHAILGDSLAGAWTK